MPGHVIGKSLLRGFAGTISRQIDAIVEALTNKEDSAAIEFGAPVVLSSANDGVVNWGSGNSATDFVGIAVREIKTENTYGLGDAKYNAGDVVNVLTRGSISVVCTKDSTATHDPVKNGAVYIRKASGKFVAYSESSDTVELSGVVWAQNGLDANGIAEIVILDRKA